MSSTYTASLRFNLQGTGDNFAVWGAILNSGVFSLVDASIAGRAGFALSGSKTLTSANGAADEARQAFLDITSGSGGTITIPGVSKLYLVRNNTSGNAVFTTGGGLTTTVASGNIVWIVCDGTNVRLAFSSDFQGSILTNVGTPSTTTDGVNKAYADSILTSANAYTDSVALASGNLPSVVGQSGRYLTNNGAAAMWAALAGPFVGNLTGNVTGNLIGNVTGNVSGSSGSCTGNAATATLADNATLAGSATSAGTATTAVNLSGGVVDSVTVSAGTPGVRVRASASGSAFLQFTNNANGVQWGILEAASATAPLTTNGLSIARVASGTSANSGRISWGTAAPGILDEGQIYLQHA